jgi:hypothetical protein
MGKRVLIGVFWFLAFAYMFQFAGAMYGIPPELGILISLGIGLFIGMDPFAVLWKRRPSRRIATIPAAHVPSEAKRARIHGL